jgi:two-component system nitrate/nitrite sensor histidine kinase NarX
MMTWLKKTSNQCFLAIAIAIGLVLFSILANDAIIISGLVLAIIVITISLISIWSSYIQPAENIQAWTEMIRGGQLDAKIKPSAGTESQQLNSNLHFIGEMLQSLSRDAELQVQRHTDHIAHKTRSLSILYDIASSINLSRSVETLLSEFLHTLTELINAQSSCAYLISDETEVELLTHINVAEALITLHENLCLDNQTNDDGSLRIKLMPCDQYLCKKYFSGEEIDILIVPLQYQEKLLGIYHFYVHKKSLNMFNDYHELFTSIGRQLGAAIEKAHLDEETRSLSIMRERTHIANELHDSLAQTLTSIRFQVRVLDETLHQGNEAQGWTELEKIESSISEAHNEIRELIAHFRSPTVLASLISSVQSTVDRFRQVNDEIQVFFQNEWPDADLPAETEFHVLRIIQESLNNILNQSVAL